MFQTDVRMFTIYRWRDLLWKQFYRGYAWPRQATELNKWQVCIIIIILTLSSKHSEFCLEWKEHTCKPSIDVHLVWEEEKCRGQNKFLNLENMCIMSYYSIKDIYL